MQDDKIRLAQLMGLCYTMVEIALYPPEAERQQEEFYMKKKADVRRMTELALLMAIIILMTFTPLGYLPTPWGLSITLIVIPVAVGGIILGPKAGAFLGATFGLFSFIKTFTPMGSVLNIAMLEASLFKFIILCLVPRVLVGLLPALIYWGLRKFQKIRTVSQALCCFLTPIFNTLFYMTFCWLLFSDTWLANAGLEGSGIGVLGLMLSTVAVNGIVEAAACLVLGTPVSKALLHALHRDEK